MITAGLLAACASQPAAILAPAAIGNAAAWEQHLIRVQSLAGWQLAGRLAVRTQDEGFSANLRWLQNRAGYLLRLSGPLGQDTYELRGAADGVTLLTADNRLLTATDPERLMQENLGWSVPLSGLKYWVRGIPGPDFTTEDLEVDERGLLVRLRQAGWRVAVEEYLHAGGIDLPRRLTLENDRFRLKLVIHDWNTAL
jgi:outer membrane lipoprotein LolB